MTKTWDEMTPRERDALVAERMGWVRAHPDLWERPDGQLPAYTGERIIRTPCMPFHPTTDHNACRLVEDEIEWRGLVEKYQDELIKVLGLEDEMQVFNSAIELSWYHAPDVPNNEFTQDGHACLWLFSHATPDKKCRAACRAMGVEV